MASFVFVVPVSYLGGRMDVRKPRWVGYGVFLLGIGSLIFSVPHFASDLYQASAGTAPPTHCLAANNSSCLDQQQPRESSSLSNFKAVFIFAQLVMGLGSCPLYTLGITYIDENSSNRMQPFYTGVFYAVTGLGPAIGFILGGQFLRLYVDFLVISPEE